MFIPQAISTPPGLQTNLRGCTTSYWGLLVKRFHFFFFWGGGGEEGQYFRTAFQTETISILIVDVSNVMHQLNHIDEKLSNLHV